VVVVGFLNELNFKVNEDFDGHVNNGVIFSSYISADANVQPNVYVKD
jgi:hypothetical protein